MRGQCTAALSGRPLPSVAPDLAGDGRLVPAELPRYLADPFMALPADHDVLALRDAKMAVAVHGASNDACLRKHHHRSRLGGYLVISCCTRSADPPAIATDDGPLLQCVLRAFPIPTLSMECGMTAEVDECAEKLVLAQLDAPEWPGDR